MPTEIHKKLGDTWVAMTEIQYMDGATQRDITEVYKNDAGTWRQVFGAAVSAETLAWAASTPSGTYASTGPEVAFSSISCDVSGAFNFLQFTNASGSGSPTAGTFRPGVTGVDLTSYEISINAGVVSGFGAKSAIGSGTLIDGTFQALDGTRGVRFANSTTGSGGQISVTVEIREIATPANTTGAASFILSADGTGFQAKKDPRLRGPRDSTTEFILCVREFHSPDYQHARCSQQPQSECF